MGLILGFPPPCHPNYRALALTPAGLSPAERQPLLDARRVEDWRADGIRWKIQPLSRWSAVRLDIITFPAPASSNAACGFPALRFPACFTSRVMRPIQPSPSRISFASGRAVRSAPFSSRLCLPCRQSRYRQQGRFPPPALPGFTGTTSPSATLSPVSRFPGAAGYTAYLCSADFSTGRGGLLRCLARPRQQPSLPPRRSAVAQSALRHAAFVQDLRTQPPGYLSRPPVRSLSLRSGNSPTTPYGGRSDPRLFNPPLNAPAFAGRTGSPTVGSGGPSNTFALVRSPAPIITFPAPASSNAAALRWRGMRPIQPSPTFASGRARHWQGRFPPPALPGFTGTTSPSATLSSRCCGCLSTGRGAASPLSGSPYRRYHAAPRQSATPCPSLRTQPPGLLSFEATCAFTLVTVRNSPTTPYGGRVNGLQILGFPPPCHPNYRMALTPVYPPLKLDAQGGSGHAPARLSWPIQQYGPGTIAGRPCDDRRPFDHVAACFVPMNIISGAPLNRELGLRRIAIFRFRFARRRRRRRPRASACKSLSANDFRCCWISHGVHQIPGLGDDEELQLLAYLHQRLAVVAAVGAHPHLPKVLAHPFDRSRQHFLGPVCR